MANQTPMYRVQIVEKKRVVYNGLVRESEVNRMALECGRLNAEGHHNLVFIASKVE